MYKTVRVEVKKLNKIEGVDRNCYVNDIVLLANDAINAMISGPKIGETIIVEYKERHTCIYLKITDILHVAVFKRTLYHLEEV